MACEEVVEAIMGSATQERKQWNRDSVDDVVSSLAAGEDTGWENWPFSVLGF